MDEEQAGAIPNGSEGDWLAERFEADRSRLQAVAYRMLGSASEADDAVQEAWLRLGRTGAADIDNLSGWLTTVVARVCLDVLRSRKSRREEPLSPEFDMRTEAANPEHEAVLAESVGSALVVVLQRLAPAERVAFVLHDLFGVSFEEIAGIVGRSPVAARQLASRGRRRVQGGAGEDDPVADMARHQAIVEAFFRASRGGDFQALLAVLDPNVEFRGDEQAQRMGGGLPRLDGANEVAEFFSTRRMGVAQLALIDGVAGAVWFAKDRPRVVFGFTIEDGKITSIDLSADPRRVAEMKIEVIA
ncbi:MAG: sigma-70 family RNA polymerase sigma factor [Chloroflexi bacterium]|nr:sigma-70 family RNA polymerase sigma factor [Chloroflexota bacterium]